MEYLEKLVEAQEFETVLTYAEQLLLNREVTARDLMIINSSILYARLVLGESYGATIPGRLGLRLSRDLEEWDYHGFICLNLSYTLIQIGQLPEAITLCYEFLSSLSLYKTSRQYEFKIWYNLGIAHNKTGNSSEAIKSFMRAISAAKVLNSDRFAHGTRHALIGAYIVVNDHEKIPRLLSKCLHFLRHSEKSADHHESSLWHSILRAEFGIVTKRLRRAERVAVAGLRVAEGHPRHQHQLHMLLARIYHIQGDIKKSLGHTLSARIYAIRCRRYDLELEASEWMYAITTNQPGLINEITPQNWIPFLEMNVSDSTSRGPDLSQQLTGN